MSKIKNLVIDQLNLVKQRPILFNTPMVRGIARYRKTVTRRMNGLERMNENPDKWKPYIGDYRIDKKGRLNQKFYIKGAYSDHAICPYGNIGDILWVRETWRINESGNFSFKARYTVKELQLFKNQLKWKPSIHMPKAASRIWLKITDIRIERLQSITEVDALKEGIRVIPQGEAPEWYENYLNPEQYCITAQKSFESLWVKLNGYANWDLNPWVWVIEFE